MNEHVRALRDALLARDHHRFRQPSDAAHDEAFAADLAARGVSPVLRAGARLADVLDRERPVLLPGERIVLTRTVPTTPEILTPAERADVAAHGRVHELGKVCNVCPDYATAIASGLLAPRSQAEAGLVGASPAQRDFLQAVVDSIDAVLRLVDRYAALARRNGRAELAEVLERAPRTGATTFAEALQVFRVLHYALWASFSYHNTIGRFDLHLWPYLDADLRAGRLDRDQALDLVEEFFLTFNRDSDLYPGVQQGDNGQSLVLGGIIPGVGMDVPNIAALSFPAAVTMVVHQRLASATSFAEIQQAAHQAVADQAAELAGATRGLVMEPAPFLSVLMTGCLERRADVSTGLRYNNYGIHGVGLSTAADSLAAIRTLVFDRGDVTPAALLEALDDDFAGHDALRESLRRAPKLGNDDDEVDLLAAGLLGSFAAALAPLHNDRGGVFRAGTGSAMYYLLHAQQLGATPDGRRSGEYLSANLAPSLGVKVRGPLSLLHSFTKLPLVAAPNGGPVTIEVHDTVFRTAGSTEKVAMLVRSFIQDGGHQLQLNALNRDTLLDAQVHPERHRNLIVRVWGWSAYFVELDRAYQDQIIQRVELAP